MNAPDQFGNLLQTRDAATTDVICAGCIADDSLRYIVNATGSNGNCATCGGTGHTLPVGEVAALLDRVIKQNFYGLHPRYDEEYAGATLRAIVREFLTGGQACEDVIIEALKRNERVSPGAGMFYSDSAYYARKGTASDPQSQWEVEGESPRAVNG
jgi:hypothetical protein